MSVRIKNLYQIGSTKWDCYFNRHSDIWSVSIGVDKSWRGPVFSLRFGHIYIVLKQR
jgi:hypothetical protein